MHPKVGERPILEVGKAGLLRLLSDACKETPDGPSSSNLRRVPREGRFTIFSVCRRDVLTNRTRPKSGRDGVGALELPNALVLLKFRDLDGSDRHARIRKAPNEHKRSEARTANKVCSPVPVDPRVLTKLSKPRTERASQDKNTCTKVVGKFLPAINDNFLHLNEHMVYTKVYTQTHT